MTLAGMVARESKAEILKNLERNPGVIPERQIREARIAAREAQIRLLNARQRLTNLGLDIRQEDFTDLSDLERVARIRFLGLPEDLTSTLDAENTTSNLLPVCASFDGVIIHHDANLGETVDADKPIFGIADVRRMSIRLSIPKENASRLKLGQRVEFHLDGLTESITGEITWISTQVDPHSRTL